MVIPREAKSTGRPGAAPLAPGRSAARGARARLAAVVTMVCAVAVFGAVNLGAGRAGAAMTRGHATTGTAAAA
ncbi:MAG: hypothetical protein ABSF03_22845, partial [Streptosporangiaceae bacterium]